MNFLGLGKNLASASAMAILAAMAAGAQTTDGGIYVALPNNVLTPTEASSGYQLLWNGKDWTGWKSYNTSQPGSNFVIIGMAGQENGAKKSLSADSNVMEVVGSGEENEANASARPATSVSRRLTRERATGAARG